MSAPWAIGRMRAGVAQVASTMNGMPHEWARSATAFTSQNDCWGFDGRFHVEEAGVLVDLGLPVLDVLGMEDPADFDAPLLRPCAG